MTEKHNSISLDVQRLNQCLSPTRPPPMSDSIIPFDRFHGQTIASERNYICTVRTVRNYICTVRTVRLLPNLSWKNVILRV